MELRNYENYRIAHEEILFALRVFAEGNRNEVYAARVYEYSLNV